MQGLDAGARVALLIAQQRTQQLAYQVQLAQQQDTAGRVSEMLSASCVGKMFY
jgi:hypothetical protein